MSKAETEAKMKVLEESDLKVSDPSPELAAGLRALGDKLTGQWLKRAGPNGERLMRDFRENQTAGR